MIYNPTIAQQLIMQAMRSYPETPKVIASRLPQHISRQNVSQQCRIMADNDAIKQHGRGKFSLRPECEASFRGILDTNPDYVPPQTPKKLQKKPPKSTIDMFAEQFPDHYRWLINASNGGNTFSISLLAQLHKGWWLSSKQMACVEKSLVW